MPSQEIRARVDRRLEELYRRHLSLHDDEVEGYYESGVGYHRPEIPGAEQKSFSICLATTDGEVFVAGGHDLRSRCSLSPRRSSTGWPWRRADASASWRGSGSSLAATLSTPSSSTSATTARSTRWSTRGRLRRPI